jgi:hypothetical protein
MFASGTRGLDARDLAELRRLRRNLDLIRDWCWLMKQKLALERRYRPDQTRVPAGNSDGGRWTREGAGKPSERPGSSNLGSQSRQPARERGPDRGEPNRAPPTAPPPVPALRLVEDEARFPEFGPPSSPFPCSLKPESSL